MTKLAILVVISAALAMASAPAPDSSMFRGSPEHTGVYASANVPTLSDLQWKFKTTGKVISSPVVDGDAVYVGSTASIAL